MATLATHRLSMKTLPALLFPLLLALGAADLRASGFTEPPITFYGTVTHSADGYTIPITEGTISWTIQPPTGAPIVVTAKIEPHDELGSLYRLEIPVEKVPSTFTITPGAVPASTAVSYGRAGILLNGSTQLVMVDPAAESFPFAETQRGKRERVDLIIEGPFPDTDGDGLPDWWEDKYFLDKYDPGTPDLPDPFDRRTYGDDYPRHIDPEIGTEYDQWTVAKNIPTTIRKPEQNADTDFSLNLMEFALDANPNNTDVPFINTKQFFGIESFEGLDYLTMTVNKPGRLTAVYVIETTGDLAGPWSDAGVVTLTNTTSLLKARDSVPVSPTAPARYIRLRVVLDED
jgi:hypothetical protein